jgi:maleate isomerase
MSAIGISTDLPGGALRAAHDPQPSSAGRFCYVHNVPENAEAVFIGGNGFRAIGIISALEQSLAKLVLTANQVALWQALHLSGRRAPILNYGQIFQL